jgi:hypothetical protein
LFICGDFNGHVGGEAEGYEGVHGCHGFGRRNLEGELLLQFAEARDLVVANTWFTKKEKQMVTYESGGVRGWYHLGTAPLNILQLAIYAIGQYLIVII